ncbi:MAG: protein-glutamate O-methyltransferase CheR [Planctomycetes bacterium]|nr:protein-glutamate O-methyltransferase CheR [Planctomycetota bacterium]
MEVLKLTPKEFSRFAKLVYDRTGISLADRKLALLSNRLRRRLKALNLETFDAYYKYVSSPSGMSDDELAHFLSAVTTNETYFFRNEKLWTTFETDLIPYFVRTKGDKNRTLRIWSAASSSGEEAYTAAIALRENLPGFDRWQITIIGTDISKKMLDKAKQAVYGEYAVSRMDKTRIKTWFDASPGEFRLKPEVRKMVRFQFHNLRESFPNGRFDLVFLRNVLMYFDTPMKLRVLEVVTEALAPGGHLIIGDVDPVSSCDELREALTLEKIRPGTYCKPNARSVELPKKELVTR